MQPRRPPGAHDGGGPTPNTSSLVSVYGLPRSRKAKTRSWNVVASSPVRSPHACIAIASPSASRLFARRQHQVASPESGSPPSSAAAAAGSARQARPRGVPRPPAGRRQPPAVLLASPECPLAFCLTVSYSPVGFDPVTCEVYF